MLMREGITSRFQSSQPRYEICPADPFALVVDSKEHARYITFHQEHFVALRHLEGSWEVNFNNRCHTWEPAILGCFDSMSGILFERGERAWAVNLLGMEAAFEIVPEGTNYQVHQPVSDTLGGSDDASSTVSTLFRQPCFVDSEFSNSGESDLFDIPCFIDSEFSDSDSAGQPFTGPCRFESIQEACMNNVINALCDSPHLWQTLPCPVSQDWESNFCQWKESVEAACRGSDSGPGIESRAAKRLQCWLGCVKAHSATFRLHSPTCVLPNPFDLEIPKRLWEKQFFEARQLLKGQLQQSDALGGSSSPSISSEHRPLTKGGSDVSLMSALAGEPLFVLPLSEEEQSQEFLHIVRNAVCHRFALPYFCINVVSVSRSGSWLDLGQPPSVPILLKSKTFEFTEDLFSAIESMDVLRVLQVLEHGQDPNCVLLETALTRAASVGNAQIVHLLLKAKADVNFMSVNSHSALHGSAMHDNPTTAKALLMHGATPNLVDSRGNSPLHYAVLSSPAVSYLLLASGADALQRDLDSDTPFSLAPPGLAAYCCLRFCWTRVPLEDIILRHTEELASFVCLHALFPATSRIHRQSIFVKSADRVGGSSQFDPQRMRVSHNRKVARYIHASKPDLELAVPSERAEAINLSTLGLHSVLPDVLSKGFVQQSILPKKPTQWHEEPRFPVVIDHLKFLHGHERRERQQVIF